MRFSLPVALLLVFPLSMAEASSLETTLPYSLCLTQEKTLNGYFPVGFVHGRPESLVYEGFNLRDHGPRLIRFHDTGLYPAPVRLPDTLGSRYFSRTNAADALGGSLLWAVKHGHSALHTKLYGAMQPSIGPNGEPYSRSQILCNVFDPATRRYLMDYVQEHVKASTASPLDERIVVWGLDNEWEGAPNYSLEARDGFAHWLAGCYGDDLAGLNAAWGSSFDSFAAAAKGSLPAPKEYAANPGKFLDWWNFQTDRFTEVLAEMAQTMHDTDPRGRGVIHKATQQTIEMPMVNREKVFDHDLFAQRVRPASGGLYGIDMYGAGDRQMYELSYIDHCIRPLDRQPGYGVMLCETNNHDGPGHQLASTLWRMLPNGLKALDLFTPGYPGAKGDWDKFAFLDAVTGRPKEKMFYAARWAHMLHRSEKFWTESIPAPGMPRVAILMPRLDMLLSEPQNPSNRWDYPENRRWFVFRWLREQGYWVDVLPSSKLTGEYLKGYDALFLIGAEHLVEEGVSAVKNYVAEGGVLVADLAPGRFDEHHRLRPSGGLVPLLGTVRADAKAEKMKFSLGTTSVVAGAFSTVSPVHENGARAIGKTEDGQRLAWLVDHGRGRVLSFPFALGSLRLADAASAVVGKEAVGPTAVSEEYAAFGGELVISRWLRSLLQEAGVQPAYQLVSSSDAEALGRLRIEQPMVDVAGNCAVIVANRAQAIPAQEVLPSQTIELALPPGDWKQAWWAPAESDGLIPVRTRLAGKGRVSLDLPEIATAGVLYFFQNHAPLLGIAPIRTEERSVDGWGARVKPGETWEAKVQVVNAFNQPLAPGMLRLLVPDGWTVTPEHQATPTVPVGESAIINFSVTVNPDSSRLHPDWLYPVVARWNDGTADTAVITANVEAVPDLAEVPYLLSDNLKYSEGYPYRIPTKATYRYLNAPKGGAIADPVKAASASGETGHALLNGFGHPGGQRESRPNDTAYYAQYDTRQVELLFDLKGEHRVRQVKVVYGPGPLVPSSIRLATSGDGETFTPQADLATGNAESVSELFSASARYVRLQVEWSENGGTLDEVEIFGK